MRASIPSIRLLAAIAVASLVASSSLAQSTEAPGASDPAVMSEQPTAAANAPAAGAEWPCEQPLRPEMSLGAMWSGPDPAQKDWRKVPPVVALIGEVAPRRTPQEEAVERIQRFAAGYQGAERTEVLTTLFAGLFETLNAERNDIVQGIKRFYRRQDALARRMEEAWKEIGEIDPNATDPKLVEQRVALQQQVDWDARVFDDRQRLLHVVCEQPRVLEQRVFAFSRAIQEQLALH